MLMRVENELSEVVTRRFTGVRSAVEYLEDNMPCNKSGSILILVSEDEETRYKATADGKPTTGWQVINDPKYKQETLIEVVGSCIERRD